MKMTTETVPSFTPKFGGIEDCKSFTNIELKEQISLDYRNGYHSGVKRYGMPLDELDTIRDGDFPIRVKKVKDSEKDLVSKENEHNALNGTSKVNGDSKKKRNTRKRNRSDMSPEELRRLRERERKAQQSRRDRIRAQKKQNQAWHDDEAAWEAFLDQTDEKKGIKTNRKHTSSIPSMVCAIESNHVKPDMGDDGEKILDESKNLEKQNSHETESIAESNPSAYTSDENSNHESSKDDTKKSSKEQFSDNESYDDRDEIPSKDRSVKEEPKNSEMVRRDHHSEHERRNSSIHSDKRHHRSYYLSSPPPNHHPYHAKVSPHSHHTREYYPTLYAPDSHHPHFSPPESKHYLSGPRQHHESRHESRHHHHHDSYEKKGPFKHYYPPHFIPIIHGQPDSPNHESKHKQSSSSPHCEKKKMISRNVDRKKLSEEELEELRRRERDYQRERRARIRMEKAKTQAEQERFHKARDIIPSGYYHRHPADVYRHVHHHERPMAARYDALEHYAHRQLSPNASKYNQRKSAEKPQHSEQLEVKIPDHQVEEKKAEKPETDLLQVVPKTRDYEEKHISPTATSSPVEEEPVPRKSLLETICSSLKKDSTEWNDKSDDRLVIDLKEEEKKESLKEFSPDLAKLKEELISKDFRAESQQSDDQKLRDKMTEDQLERRRRSNREAQRRRRARLKMQGHMEERHEFEHYGEEMEKEKDVYDARKDQIKTRPDTLYMQSLHDIYPQRGSRHHEHIYLPHEKYGHHMPKEHFSYKPYMYHRPMHHGMDMDDSPRHHPHFYYDALRSPDYHHRERLVHHHPHLQHHHEKIKDSKSPHTHNHEEDRHNSVPRDDEDCISPSPESSSCKNNESRDSRDDSTSEHDISIKSGGGRKKRKQFAPRKLASSANTTPDEDVDIMTDNQNVVILNGPDENENNVDGLNNQADVSEEE